MATRGRARGQMPTGPSEAYLRLIRGEISPKKYAEHVKKNVNRQLGKQGGSATAAKRSA